MSVMDDGIDQTKLVKVSQMTTLRWGLDGRGYK
jgi:hypothetical protein